MNFCIEYTPTDPTRMQLVLRHHAALGSNQLGLTDVRWWLSALFQNPERIEISALRYPDQV